MSLSSILISNGYNLFCKTITVENNTDITLTGLTLYNNTNTYASGLSLRVLRQGKQVTLSFNSDSVTNTIGPVNDLFIGTNGSPLPVPAPSSLTRWIVAARLNGTNISALVTFPSFGNNFLNFAPLTGGSWTSTSNGGIYAFSISYLTN